MHIVFLCIRFLRKRRIAFFGTAAVALCVTLLIVITSLFTGFIDSFQSYWRNYYGDFMFTTQKPVANYTELAAVFEAVPGVRVAQPTLRHGGLLYLGRGNVRAVELVGVDFERWQRLNDKPDTLLAVWPQGGLVTGELPPSVIEQAAKWHLERFGRPMEPGDRPAPALVGIGVLATPDETTDAYDTGELLAGLRQLSGPLPIISGVTDTAGEREGRGGYRRINRLCWPVAVVRTGSVEVDNHKLFLPIEQVAAMIGPAGDADRNVDGLVCHISVAAGVNLDTIEDELFGAWKRYAVEKLEWPVFDADNVVLEQTAHNFSLVMFTREIRKQLYIMQWILGLICLVAALLVFVILMMIVMQKKRDIGIVRALGSSPRGIAWLFVLYGGGIGLAGSLAGVVLGVWCTWKIEALEALVSRLLGFKIWVTDVYLFSEIPNQVDWPSLVWIVLAGVLTATLGALLPAWRAARLQPVEALRYE